MFFTNCEALAKRFGHYFEDESCQLTSSFYPQFRLLWLPWFIDEPLEVENRLKRKMSDILVAEDSAAETSSSDTDHDRDEGTSDARNKSTENPVMLTKWKLFYLQFLQNPLMQIL